MKDDYLWDGTGEPDPDIQRLEQSLGRFRYQPKPLGTAFDRQLPVRRTSWWPMLAAAAAIVVMALVGMWLVNNRQRSDARQPLAVSPGAADPVAPLPDSGGQKEAAPPSGPEPQKEPAFNVKKEAAGSMKVHLAREGNPTRKAAPAAPKEARPKQVEPDLFDSLLGASVVAVVQPIVVPFVDVETSKHIERSQMLLRSFRNIDDADGRNDSEIAYEKQQSRGLLLQNIVLRRDAQAKGNMPVEDLLGTLEPFLIDIANLPEKPSKDELLAVKERMRKKEIVSALQIYSAPTLGQVFK